ncbi:hypothetical protein LINPERPRIM_LOCUS37896 [Linum perenne]
MFASLKGNPKMLLFLSALNKTSLFHDFLKHNIKGIPHFLHNSKSLSFRFPNCYWVPAVVLDEMGQSLMKFAPGSEQNKGKDIGAVIEECYDKYFADTTKELSSADFYAAVCLTIEEINKKLNSTQFRIPDTQKLNHVYKSHYNDDHSNKDKRKKTLSREEFQKVLEEIIISAGFTGFGSKNIFFYIFGVPAAAMFIKQRISPTILPNEVFIPVITSSTVLILAKLNKI